MGFCRAPAAVGLFVVYPEAQCVEHVALKTQNMKGCPNLDKHSGLVHAQETKPCPSFNRVCESRQGDTASRGVSVFVSKYILQIQEPIFDFSLDVSLKTTVFPTVQEQNVLEEV